MRYTVGEVISMMLREIEPFVRQAIIANFNAAAYERRKLRAPDCRLFYLLHGVGEIAFDGRVEQLRDGSIVLLQGGTEYEWRIREMRYIAVNFDYTQDCSHVKGRFSPIYSARCSGGALLPPVSFSDAPALNAPLVLPSGTYLEGRIMQLAIESQAAGSFRDELLSALLKSVLISVARLEREATSAAAARLAERVIAYVEENYASQIKNAEIAAHLHFTPAYVNRVFKAHVGTSLRSFIVDYRIHRATELLSERELSVGEVALAVGFTDLAHFIKTFRARVGTSPLAFRRGALSGS